MKPKVEKPEHLAFGSTYGTQVSLDWHGDNPQVTVGRQVMGTSGWPKRVGEISARLLYARHCREIAAWFEKAAQYMEEK